LLLNIRRRVHMRLTKRIISLMIAICLMASNIPTGFIAHAAHAGPDFENHWAQDNIQRVMREGWVSETENFRPDDVITRAEFITLINNMMGFVNRADISHFSDVSPGDWFYQSISIAVGHGYIFGLGDGMMGPNYPITRTQAIAIFTRLAGLDTSAPQEELINGIRDWASVPEWGRAEVLTAIAAGFVSGTGDGYIQGSAYLTRAEAVRLLLGRHDNVRVFAFPGTYEVDDASAVLIIGSDIIVAIAEGAVVGEATIASNVSNSGIVVRNGASVGAVNVETGAQGNTVTLERNTNVRDISVSTGAVDTTVIVSGDASASEITVEDGAINTTIIADRGSQITDLVVEAGASGTTVENREDAEIDNAVINAPTNITGEGSIGNAEINSEDVYFETAPGVTGGTGTVNIGARPAPGETQPGDTQPGDTQPGDTDPQDGDTEVVTPTPTPPTGGGRPPGPRPGPEPTPTPNALTGIARIQGEIQGGPRIGTVLTGALLSGNNTGELSAS